MNMQWLIYLRQTSLTIGCITAIITHAMGSLNANLSGVAFGSLEYAYFSVGAGVATILSLPFFLLYDMAQERSYAATVLFELIWLLGLIIVWIVAGVKTIGVTSTIFKSCNSDIPNFPLLCSNAQTAVVFSLLTAGVLGLYTAALGIVAASQASSGKPIWTSFKMGGAKKH